MDIRNLRQKSSSPDERAVSPVIGVVLMVAIVVLLAAVVAGVMTGMVGDMGQTEAQGAAEFSVNEDKNTVTVSVTSLSDADEMHLAGDANGNGDMWTNDSTSDLNSGSANTTWTLSDEGALKVGETHTFKLVADAGTKSGTITAVAVKETEDGETIRTTVGSQDFDFSGS